VSHKYYAEGIVRNGLENITINLLLSQIYTKENIRTPKVSKTNENSKLIIHGAWLCFIRFTFKINKNDKM